MNVFEVKPSYFKDGVVALTNLKATYFQIAFLQDFIYFVLPSGGILILKDRYTGKEGVYFAE